MKPAEIGNYGERLVENFLRAEGYRCERNTQLPGSTDIEAYKGEEILLIQVKTALFPNKPDDLSSDERRNLSSRASKIGAKPGLAQLQINEQGKLVGKIRWKKLK